MEKYRKESIEDWNNALEDALEFRREYGREQEWGKCESLYYQANKSQQDNVGPNLLAGTGDALLSSLLVPNPFFVLKALRADVLNAVPVLESVLNTLIYSLGLRSQIEQSCLHAYLFGRGILKLGYDSEFGYNPLHDIGQSANAVLGLSLSQFDKKGSKIEYDTSIVPGMPWVRSVLPHDFVVPYGTIVIKDTPWCAHRCVRHIDDIRADSKYENTKGLEPMLSMSDWVKSYLTVLKPYRMGRSSTYNGRREGSDKVEYVELWEIHDARTGRVKVLSQGYDKWLRNEIDYLQEDGLPFVSLGFIPSSRTFWTTPDSVYLHPTQEEAIDIASIMKKQRRIALLKFLYKEGAMDNEEIEKFLSGEIGIAAKYRDGHGDNPIFAITAQTNNQNLQQEAEYMRRDARETVGFSRNQQGEYEQSGRRTATEASIVQQNADQRLNKRQQAMADTYCEIGRKLSKIIFKFWRTPRLTEIIGKSGAAEWTAFTGGDLKGEYQFKVGFSSEPVEGLKARQQNAIMLYQWLSQDPTIDPIALRRYLVRAFNDPEFASLFKPGVISGNLPVPMSQMQPPVGGAFAPASPGGPQQPGLSPV